MSEDTGRAEGKPPHLDRLSVLWRRLNEHKIVQWSIAYVALAYAIQHAIILTSESFEWPNAVARVSMLVLVLGLPLVVTFAWYHGAKASRNFSQAELSILAALLVMSSLLFYVFVRPSEQAGAPGSQQAGVTAARNAAASAKGAISLAVLPFVNLSSDKEQEFFSDGMTEEIVTALAKIPALRVVARESAFQFRGGGNDMRAVGEKLGATHLIEGSVRKVGDRLRITVQLVKADDGLNVWASSYDRQLTDVFAIQEDIATAIAGALRMPLGLKPGEHLVVDRTPDQQTYELYLRGRAALRTRSRQELDLLEEVAKHDPNFAPGAALLSEARREMALFYQRNGDESKRAPLLEGSQAAARKAIALDPTFVGGYSALAAILAQGGKWAEAMDLYKQGLSRDPDDPELLNNYSQALRALGYLREALTVKERLFLLEPLIGLYNRQKGELLMANGKREEGTITLVVLDRQGAPGVGLGLIPAFAEQGRFEEAMDVLMRFSPPRAGPFSRPFIDAVMQVLRAAAKKSASPKDLPVFDSEMNFAYAYAGTPERMLEWPEKALNKGDYRPLEYIWWPTPSAVRQTERFKALVRKAGFVEYWRAKGWPDRCHPTTGDDFACE